MQGWGKIYQRWREREIGLLGDLKHLRAFINTSSLLKGKHASLKERLEKVNADIVAVASFDKVSKKIKFDHL